MTLEEAQKDDLWGAVTVTHDSDKAAVVFTVAMEVHVPNRLLPMSGHRLAELMQQRVALDMRALCIVAALKINDELKVEK
jgi:hypothetical protein